MRIYVELAKLTDSQVDSCLSSVINRYSSGRTDLRELVSQEGTMRKAVTLAAAKLNVKVGQTQATSVLEKQAATRLILVEMAALPEFKNEIVEWLKGDRENLREPLTSALVVAGVVLVLSLDVEFTYERVGGKGSVRVRVRKSPTSTKILQTMAGFF